MQQHECRTIGTVPAGYTYPFVENKMLRVLTTRLPGIHLTTLCLRTTLGCVFVSVCGGFVSRLQGHRVGWSYWQFQGGKDSEKGDTAALMAHSSCLWSALHSVHMKNLLSDESGVELERKAESEVERRWRFLMGTSIWQGHSFLLLHFHQWPVTHAFISRPSVYLPHLSAGHFLCLFELYSSIVTGNNNINRIGCVWSLISCHACLSHYLSACSEPIILFNSLWWSAHFCNANGSITQLLPAVLANISHTQVFISLLDTAGIKLQMCLYACVRAKRVFLLL